MPLSYSQLQIYRVCPRQYEYAFVKNIPRFISAGESFGTSVHSTLSRFGKREMENEKLKMDNGQLRLFMGDDTPKDIALTADFLLELWHQSFITEGYASKSEADAARAKGEKLMRHFYEWWSHEQRNVLSIESGFTIAGSEQEISISGRFDRVEQLESGVRVIDFKTSAPCTQEEADQNMQLSLYAKAAEHVFEKPCIELILLFLREDGVTPVRTLRNSMMIEQALGEASSIAQGIAEGSFAPTPSVPKCSRCPYRSICDASMA